MLFHDLSPDSFLAVYQLEKYDNLIHHRRDETYCPIVYNDSVK